MTGPRHLSGTNRTPPVKTRDISPLRQSGDIVSCLKRFHIDSNG